MAFVQHFVPNKNNHKADGNSAECNKAFTNIGHEDYKGIKSAEKRGKKQTQPFKRRF